MNARTLRSTHNTPTRTPQMLVLWSFLWAAAEISLGWDHPVGTGSALWGGEGTTLETQLTVWGVVLFTAIVRAPTE